MGALDFLKEFEGRAIDAASYKLLRRNFEMQDQNNQLLSEKCRLLEEQVQSLTTHIRELERENSGLRGSAAKEQFVVHEGFAFRRKPDGTFEETPYCPNCNSVMGNALKRHYTCAKCEYHHQSRTLPSVLAHELSRKQEESQQPPERDK